MSNPQIVVEMDADEAKMWQKFKRIENAEGGVEAALKAIGRATKDVSNENAKMERAAAQTLRSIQTPQERYNQKIGELKHLYDKNKLSLDQYRRAVEQVESQYKRASDSGEDAFGDKALRNLVQYTAGIASIAALLGKAVQMFHDLDAEAQAAFDRMKDSRAGLAELAGLAKSPEEAQQLVETARKAYERGVGKSEDEAAGLHYKLKSTGLYEERKVFEDLSKSGVVTDVIPTIGATAKIQAAMGKAETGDATAVLSKLYQASDVTQYRMEEIARAAAEPALFAGKLGMKDEELLAQLAGGLQTLDVSKVDSGARAYYQALLQRGGFEGLSAEKQMAEVKKRLGTMDAEEQKKFFGSIEAQTFYEALMTQQGQQTFREQMVALPEAERTQLAIQKTMLPEVDTGLRRTRIAGEATRRREAQDIPEGRDRALAEAIIEDRVASLKSEGRDVEAWMGRQLWGMTRFLGSFAGRGDKMIIESAGNFRDALSADTQAELKRYWEERRGQTRTPATPQTAGQIGGPKPGDLITPVVPVPAAAADPRIDKTNDLLEKIHTTLERNAPRDNRTPRPMPAASAAANTMNRE